MRESMDAPAIEQFGLEATSDVVMGVNTGSGCLTPEQLTD
jgi:hypothetical protein